jgi:hypothetical protein
MALTKSKKHFVGLTWAEGDKKGGFAMQCDKNDYRGVLAGLEGVTGKKAVDSDAMTVKNGSSGRFKREIKPRASVRHGTENALPLAVQGSEAINCYADLLASPN